MPPVPSTTRGTARTISSTSPPCSAPRSTTPGNVGSPPGFVSPTSRSTLEEFDFDFQPSIDPKVLFDLAELDFVAEGPPILLLGRPGPGKSYLGVALGIRAVEAGYRGYFTGATEMTKALVAAWAEGTFNPKIRTSTAPSVLIIDDVGITPFDRTEANAFFQVVNRRYELRSATIVMTNRGLPAWAELFGGDSVVAAAILDRLLDPRQGHQHQRSVVAPARTRGADQAARRHDRPTRQTPEEAGLACCRSTGSTRISVSETRDVP